MEGRVTREFSGMLDERVRDFWCDGLLPERYFFDGRRPRITGIAWLGQTGQEKWQFTLRLHRGVRNLATVDWAGHFPPWNVTRWISLDLERRRIEMEPTAAVADLR
jgi:hypothetical protein